jgi:hypothetical protein
MILKSSIHLVLFFQANFIKLLRTIYSSKELIFFSQDVLLRSHWYLFFQFSFFTKATQIHYSKSRNYNWSSLFIDSIFVNLPNHKKLIYNPQINTDSVFMVTGIPYQIFAKLWSIQCTSSHWGWVISPPGPPPPPAYHPLHPLPLPPTCLIVLTFILFGGEGAVLRFELRTTTWAMPPTFCFSYFSDMLLYFFGQTNMDHNPPLPMPST